MWDEIVITADGSWGKKGECGVKLLFQLMEAGGRKVDVGVKLLFQLMEAGGRKG